MSLDVYLTAVRSTTVYDGNITHNLNRMAAAAGIYSELWRPGEIGISKASQLIAPLEKGLRMLKETPDMFTQYNAANGWGKYEHLVKFVEEYLNECRENPDADVRVSR
jgi:hypothetical protein